MGRSGHRLAFTRALAPEVAASSGTVLDVGGGRDSPLAGAFAASAVRIRLDVRPDGRPDVCGDAHRLPVADASVDAVVCCEVLEHVAEPTVVAAELRRVLRPGGELLGSVPFLSTGVHADPHDYYRYTADGLRQVLASFDEVEVRPHGNGVGAAWRLVQGRRGWLLPLNPLLRLLSRRTDPDRPEGYTFRARRAREA